MTPATPQLSTRRLVLRPLNVDDASALFEARGDAEAMLYWDWAPQHSVDHVAKVIADHGKAIAAGEVLWWAVALTADGLAIGECDLSEIDEHNRRAEVGFLFRRASWGKGYAREAMNAVVEHAFETMRLERLSARVHAGNERGRRLLEKLGFSYEGMARGHVLREGRRIDCLIFGMVRDNR
ncbi:MAG: GNAT family N-acetyltransferase [Alphaproteobacteria bacterium]|nr:GNAT family N-acetyltransferase [Alphaproteobacteria bacterium]